MIQMKKMRKKVQMKKKKANTLIYKIIIKIINKFKNL